MRASRGLRRRWRARGSCPPPWTTRSACGTRTTCRPSTRARPPPCPLSPRPTPRSPRARRSLRATVSEISCMVLLEGEGLLATGSDDGSVRWWNPETGRCVPVRGRPWTEERGGYLSPPSRMSSLTRCLLPQLGVSAAPHQHRELHVRRGARRHAFACDRQLRRVRWAARAGPAPPFPVGHTCTPLPSPAPWLCGTCRSSARCSHVPSAASRHTGARRPRFWPWRTWLPG